MSIEAFAEQHRLRVKSNGVEKMIHGKFGELADMGDEGLFRLRLLAVPRCVDSDRKLRNRRTTALAGGLKMKWQGEAESTFYFNPSDPAEVALAVKLVAAKVRRKRNLTPEQRQALAARLAAVRQAPRMAVLDGKPCVEGPIQTITSEVAAYPEGKAAA